MVTGQVQCPIVILDKPYVSGLLTRTLRDHRIATLDNEVSRALFANDDAVKLCSSEEVVARAEGANGLRVYTNSENAIEWVGRHLALTRLPETIRLFKDKLRFRDLLRGLYPHHAYRSVRWEDLEQIDPATLPMPCILKPAIGFFSVGVHVIDSAESWRRAVARLRQQVEEIKSLYPSQVVAFDTFLVEACIEGEEFAIDAYFNDAGEAIILNILGHLFASADDVGDRVYVTSAALIRRWLQPFTEALRRIGRLAELRNFPIHAEVRVDDTGKLGFIEINPLRFTGWCAGDIVHHAYGFNPYEYYLTDRAPDWDAILAERSGNVFGIVVADVPSGVDRAAIASVDYEGLAALFTKPLELRRIDFTAHPLMAFLFVEADPQALPELQAVLRADLRQFLRFKQA